MPVYSFSVRSSTTFYLIWKIEESLAALRPQLHAHFLADFQTLNLSSKDKMLQSMAVRIALYSLLKALDLPILPLSKDLEGRPFLRDSSFHISFTHTRYLAAVALSTDFPTGIDIEIVKPSLHMVQEKFLREEEIKEANYSLEKLAIYWSAKEALYKRLDTQPTPTFKDIFIAPFELQTKGKIVAYVDNKKYRMGYQSMIGATVLPHVLVYCES